MITATEYEDLHALLHISRVTNYIFSGEKKMLGKFSTPTEKYFTTNARFPLVSRF
jgi:hypothetical protein